MKIRFHSQGASRQHGIALLVFAAIAGVIAIALLVSQLSTANIRLERDKITADALAKAKDALIAYAAAYDLTHPPNNVPGYLPCPETTQPLLSPDAEGQIRPISCGAQDVSVLGKLPWKTLGLAPLRDGDGECLWYAVSGSHKYNPKTDMMNWDTLGQFEVVDQDGVSLIVGATAHSRAVAIIFAPGSPLPGQDRTPLPNTPNCGGNYTASNYLDTDASSGINNSAIVTTGGALTRFIAGKRSATFNDRFIVITADDIFNAVRRRLDFQGKLDAMTLKAAQCIAIYGTKNGTPTIDTSDKRLPWAAPVAMPALPDFLDKTKYNDDPVSSSPVFGRVPYVLDHSKAQTLNSGGILDANCSPTPTEVAWYDNWKDHLFYAVAGAFKPDAATPTFCGTGKSCLTVNSGGLYAAVVMFAGPRLAGQLRATPDEKSLISNYLEGRNRTNHPNMSGKGDYQSGATSASFNDKLYCIDPQVLGVSPCP